MNASVESELCSESDEVVTSLNMVETAMPKLEMVLEKLGRLEAKLDSLENCIKAVYDKVSNLQGEEESLKMLKTETVKELEEGMSFPNSERESFKEELKKMGKELSLKLKDEKLYMEVYQR